MTRIALATVLAIGLTASAQDAPDLVVHEWGTFTAVYGADGTMMEWRPLIGEDLPSFVYDRATIVPRVQSGGKKEMVSYERMETPVLYFYTDRETAVDVSVRFPKGLITEWYPLVHDLQPAIAKSAPPVRDGAVRWWGTVLPKASPALPTAGDSNHYYHARETDSAVVRVRGYGDDKRDEYEKFLFYRGVGNFDLPLSVKTAENARFAVANPTGLPIRHLFALRIERDGTGRFGYADKVEAGATCAIAADGEPLAKEAFVRAIGAKLEESLVAEGLFRKEAKAMVKTWTDSYFQTEGTRLLYVLPESLTNELLPLTIKPAPKQVKRVLVARVDVMTPEQTRSLHEMIRELGADAFDAREAASKRIASYGRFAQPALAEAIRTAEDPEIRSRAKDLLDKLAPRR
jgi:hypothetical protein